MKKLIAAICVLALSLVVSIPVFAAENSTTAAQPAAGPETLRLQLNNTKAKVKGLMAKAKQNRAGIENFCADFSEFRAKLQEGCDENHALVKENAELRKALFSKLNAMQDSGIALTPEVKDQLTDYHNQLIDIRTGLKQTKGEIKDLLSQYKDNQAKLDEAALDQLYAKITEIREARKADLTKINEILKKMTALLE